MVGRWARSSVTAAAAACCAGEHSHPVAVTAATLDSVKKTGRLIVIDEASPRCNMATDISALVAQDAFKLHALLLRLGFQVGA